MILGNRSVITEKKLKKKKIQIHISSIGYIRDTSIISKTEERSKKE